MSMDETKLLSVKIDMSQVLSVELKGEVCPFL